MPKTPEAKVADENQAEVANTGTVLEDAPVQEMTLVEYCAVRSKTDRRVELLGAFHSDERRQGNVKGLATDFDARFNAFTQKPIA